MRAYCSSELSKDTSGRTCLTFFFSYDITYHLETLAEKSSINDFLRASFMPHNPVINAEYCADTRTITLTFRRGVSRFMINVNSYAETLKGKLDTPIEKTEQPKYLSANKLRALPQQIDPEVARMYELGKRMRAS